MHRVLRPMGLAHPEHAMSRQTAMARAAMARTALQGSSFASLVTGGRPSRPLGPLKSEPGTDEEEGYALSQMTRCGGEGPLPDPATSVYYACGFTRRCHTHGGCKGAAPGLRNYTYMGYSVRAAEWSWDVIILTSGGGGRKPRLGLCGPALTLRPTASCQHLTSSTARV